MSSLNFLSSQVVAQCSLGARNHGIHSQALVLNESLISLGELKLKSDLTPAPWTQILEFAKKVFSIILYSDVIIVSSYIGNVCTKLFLTLNTSVLIASRWGNQNLAS